MIFIAVVGMQGRAGKAYQQPAGSNKIEELKSTIK